MHPKQEAKVDPDIRDRRESKKLLYFVLFILPKSNLDPEIDSLAKIQQRGI